MSTSYSLDTADLDRLIAQAPSRKDQAVGKIAFDLQAYMQSHMSATSPAPVGSPPGVVSANLVNSIQAQQDGPGEWSVWGAGYGLLQEYGTIHSGARPFIMPAADEVAKTIPDAFKVLVE